MPAQEFQNVVPLEQIAGGRQLQVDTADTAPPSDAAEQGSDGDQSTAGGGRQSWYTPGTRGKTGGTKSTENIGASAKL